MSTIFVSNLSQKATEDILKRLFGTDGEIKKACNLRNLYSIDPVFILKQNFIFR